MALWAQHSGNCVSKSPGYNPACCKPHCTKEPNLAKHGAQDRIPSVCKRQFLAPDCLQPLADVNHSVVTESAADRIQQGDVGREQMIRVCPWPSHSRDRPLSRAANVCAAVVSWSPYRSAISCPRTNFVCTGELIQPHLLMPLSQTRRLSIILNVTTWWGLPICHLAAKSC